ncbi:putative dysbindin domain-containing protein 1, partial [Triplophysa rosa]
EAKAEDEAASSEPIESKSRLDHIRSGDYGHHPTGEKNDSTAGSQNTGLQHVPYTRHDGPLSSVSSLEVNFDLLDLTELTDVSDQELSEVFVELEEDDQNDLPSSRHLIHHAVSMPSPSWRHCSKTQPAREQKHCRDSETLQD